MPIKYTRLFGTRLIGTRPIGTRLIGTLKIDRVHLERVSLARHRRRSAVLTISAVLRRSMTEPLRNHGDHGGATAVNAVQAPQWHRTFGVTGV